MADTTFSAGTVIASTWLNDVNKWTYRNVFWVTQSTYGATGDGSTNDAAAIQAALDAAATAGGGIVMLPWPTSSYNIGSTSLKIPNKVVFAGLGSPSVITGSQQILYSGTDAAIVLKNGEIDAQSRGISIENIGVKLTGAGATGFRFWRVRDLLVEKCCVSFFANNQIGFHWKGEKSGGTNQGAFDCTAIRLRTYDTAGSLSGIVHYRLSGTYNSGTNTYDGACNGNSFFGLGGGGSGQFLEVGPAASNLFAGLEMEAPSSASDYIKCLAGATKNHFIGLYASDAPVGYTGKVFNVAANADYNILDNYYTGSNLNDYDVTITGNSEAISKLGDKFLAAAGSRGYGVTVAGEQNNRIEIHPNGIRYGGGSSSPLKNWPGHTVETTTYAVAITTFTPNVLTGRSKFIRFDAGVPAASTLTIAAPTNGASDEGDEVEFYIYNNSGNTVNLSWNASYVKNAQFPTTIANGARLSLKVRNVASNWWISGTPINS